MGYVRLLSRMLIERWRRRTELRHISYSEVLAYAFRQGFHLARGTYAYPCRHIRLDEESGLAYADTAFGKLYFPPSFPASELRMLCREALDPEHWHQYDTPCTRVGPGDVVVDCGTAEGLWALSIAAKCRKLILVEPQPAWLRALEKTFQRYLAEGKVVILPIAAGATDGQAYLTGGEGAIAATALASSRVEGTIAVPMKRLDTVLAREARIDFIKADVEGMELDLLRGASQVIRLHGPKIAVTVYHQANDWREIVDFVRRVVPEYHYRLKGLVAWGKPLMLHMWCDM